MSYSLEISLLVVGLQRPILRTYVSTPPATREREAVLDMLFHERSSTDAVEFISAVELGDEPEELRASAFVDGDTGELLDGALAYDADAHEYYGHLKAMFDTVREQRTAEGVAVDNMYLFFTLV